MADTVKQIGIKQQDGTYSMKDIEVDYSNVAGLSTQATSAKATADKNNKDITTYVASGSHSGSNLVLTDGAGTSSNVDLGMTGATSNTNGEAGFVPQPTSADVDKFLKADGSWATPPGKQYSGSSNISIDSSNNIDLTNTSVSSGTYGPSADVTGTNGTTISVPNISVDAKGRITNITNKTYTSVDTGSKVFTGSLSEWNQLSTAEKKTYDFISNDEPGGTGDEFPANRVSYDNTVSGLTANDVQEAVDEIIAIKTDKLTNTDSFYGTCSTAADTAAKVVTLVNADNFSLRAGITVTVKFSATNTAQNPTINVNGTGAKSVVYNTAVVTTSSLGVVGTADRRIRFTYDGTYWVWMGQSIDANITYSAMSTTELTTGTATTQRTVRADYLNAGIKSLIKSTVLVKDVNITINKASTGDIISVSTGVSYNKILSLYPVYNVDLYNLSEVDKFTGFIYCINEAGRIVLITPYGKNWSDVAAQRTLVFRVAYLA